MPHIVTDNCSGCRFTDCVTHCPVACFHGDEERLYIDPEGCIDCSACVEACPVHAIYDELDLPADKQSWIVINATRSAEFPVVRARQDALPTADERRAELGY